MSCTCIHAVLLLVVRPAPQPGRNLQPLSLWWHCLGSLQFSLWQNPQTAPGPEVLCKEMSNEERKALQVRGFGRAPAWVSRISGKVGATSPGRGGEGVASTRWEAEVRKAGTDFPTSCFLNESDLGKTAQEGEAQLHFFTPACTFFKI